ncbi:MAG: hypothetical protein CMJ78_14825 [Planctomycetaceae bacterium]|nr:hypothetical protein [Planctomycetaceae bacterium]
MSRHFGLATLAVQFLLLATDETMRLNDWLRLLKNNFKLSSSRRGQRPRTAIERLEDRSLLAELSVCLEHRRRQLAQRSTSELPVERTRDHFSQR